MTWQSRQDRLTPRCHCEPVRAWQSSLLRCGEMPKRPLDCRVAPLGSPRNDNVKTGGFPTVPLDCRIGAFTLLAMTKWDGGRCGSHYGLGTPPTMLSLRDTKWCGNPVRIGLTPRCHCEPVRAWQSSLLRCVGLPKRPLDCRVAPFGSPRNDNVKTGRLSDRSAGLPRWDFALPRDDKGEID